MTELKCPFCQQELKYEEPFYICRTPNCTRLLGFGTEELWRALIDTKKKLDIAVDALKYISGGNLGLSPAIEDFAEKALEQIKEQQ